jgi:hypothetical protein
MDHSCLQYNRLRDNLQCKYVIHKQTTYCLDCSFERFFSINCVCVEIDAMQLDKSQSILNK